MTDLAVIDVDIEEKNDTESSSSSLWTQVKGILSTEDKKRYKEEYEKANAANTLSGLANLTK